jgi:Tol biopolymer transport system component
MNARKLILVFAAAMTVLAQADLTLEKASRKETLEGDLKGAIELYRKAVDEAKEDRPLAAKALLRMAECYRKLGDTESRKIYERVLREYADQKEAVATARERLGTANSPAGPVVRTIWTGTNDVGPVTPDGRYFVWSKLSMSGDLFLHDIATGADRNLTNIPKGSPDYAVLTAIISPDGQQLIYGWQTKTSDSREELRLLNLTDDPRPRKLYGNSDVVTVFPKDWSPDGKTIAVILQRVDRTSQIGLLSVQDGSMRILKTVDWRGYGGLTFSPDGKYLGFDLPQGDTGRERDVFVLSVDGSRQIAAVSTTGNDTIVGWSPDGKWLLYDSDHTGTNDLWGLAFSDGKPQGRPERIRGNVGSSFSPLRWTSSGALYYYTRNGGGTRGQVASLNFAEGKALPSPLHQNLDAVEKLLWSDNGKELAYKSSSAHDVMVIRNIDTGVVRQVSPTKVAHFYLRSWAPDGRSILVDATEPQGRSGIYRVDTETGKASAVTLFDIPAQHEQTNFAGTSTAWMPDGRSFLINADRGRTGIYQVEAESGRRSAVFLDKPEEISSSFKLSPDGRRLYIRRELKTRHQVALVERDLTNGIEKELVRRGFLGGIDLSSDARYLATVSADSASQPRTILLIPIAGGESREPKLIHSAKIGESLTVVLGWAPDGQSLVVRKAPIDHPTDGELWLVPTDTGEAKKISGIGAGTGPIFISPDAHHFAFTVTAPATNQISVLEKFLPTPTNGGK